MKQLLALLCIQTLLLLSLSANAANTRLAIGTFGLAPENRNGDLADLITARLSTIQNLDLVERREINKVIKEAGLSLSGIVRAKDAVHLGALLRADQFLLGTSVPINGTNRLIIRLVDARTGVIRAINIFPDSGSLGGLAQDVAAFVSAEIEHPPQGRQDYLAIGVIQNLGVNNRFSDFPAQMRGYVAANLSGKVTLLERDVISFLADEVRLDMAGLTGGNGAQNSGMQFRFWIVDGFYQSYEVAEPEVQLRLRVERVQGGQQSFLLQGKPDEQFLTKICESITQALNHPVTVGATAAPTRQGETAALEARGRQLIDYQHHTAFAHGRTAPRSAHTHDKMMNTIDEATKVFESILLLDPENNDAKMRLAGCLLFDPAHWGGEKREHLEDRKARANEYYREVIASSDPIYTFDAQIELANSCGGVEGMEMMRRFAAETENQKEKRRFQGDAHELLRVATFQLPLETVMPHLRNLLLDDLKDVQESTNESITVSYDNVLFGYRFDPKKREKIINSLLPELLEKFPGLKPYLLLAAAGEQTETNSPVIAQFLASLESCEKHPDGVPRPSSYFTHLSPTLDEEKEVSQGHTLCTLYQRMFDNHQYALVIRLGLARQKAAEKGVAPPITTFGKRLMADSYMALQQWKEALQVLNELPNIPAPVKNECYSHLGMAKESEDIPESSWKDKSDITKVNIAYECIGRQQWLTAASILDSMGHRTVRMNCSGPWGWAFTPVLPASVADECRAKAGQPPLSDPMRFQIGETPYVNFIRDGNPRRFDFDVEGENLWLATYSQIKRFSGPGPFAALNPLELHEFQRINRCNISSIAISPDFIWAGTEGDGLFELDRKSGAFRRITMNEGLLLNSISSLYRQGQTLWIAYQNGQNGAIGTLDLRSHKFSALTPNLSPAAGANSQPSYFQARLDDVNNAPQLSVRCMTEGEPGEMWIAVEDKGLQRFRSSDGTWSTPWRILPQSAFFSAIAADPQHGQLLVAAREMNCLAGEKSASGGLIFYDYRRDHREALRIQQGLPSNELTAAALDGRIAWVGGRGCVAVVDIQDHKVLRIAYISASEIVKIKLDKTYAWIQVSCAPRSDSQYSGDAWTGVYRIERSKVEPLDTIAFLRK